MVVNCDIQFENNPDGIFYAGQVINGKVTLTADKVKQVKGVALKITGKARTRWSESNGKDKSSTTYWAEVDYINTLTYLMKPNASDQSVVIAPGIHTFSFACHITQNCPSSFEGYRGDIRYILKVDLIRPWKFDQTFTRAFTVLSIKNLNYDSPVLKLPVRNDVTKVFCCGACNSDPLEMQVQLPQTGFVPGQLIQISISINNNTSADINEICARLVMIIDCYSTHPRSKNLQETRTVSKLKGDPVLRFTNKQFNYFLPIPATPPTCNTLCSIIHIGYRIEVEAKMNGIMYANQCVHVPITIGNVPLQMNGVVIQQQPTSSSFSIENGVPAFESDVAVHNFTENNNNNDVASTSKRNIEPWSEIGNISPPVYMEATHMPKGQLSKDVEHDFGEKSFSPKYPVFDLSSQTSPQTCLPRQDGDEIDGHIVPTVINDPDKTTWL